MRVRKETTMHDDPYRDWQRRRQGICSSPDCGNPIEGWCDTCDAGGPFKAPKWCEPHLRAHLATHRGHVPYWQFGDPAPSSPVDPDDGGHGGGAA
jgi:hypothetical protein